MRFALGAERRHVAVIVIREALFLLATGVAVALPLSYMGVRALSALLYGTAPVPVGPAVFSLAVLLLVAAIATSIPVFRASSVDPSIALRYE